MDRARTRRLWSSTVIRQPDDARAFAAALTVALRSFAGRTAIGSANEFALASVPQRSKRGTVKVYDLEVSGDGAVIQARSIALPDMSFATPGHRSLQLAKIFREPGHKFRVEDDAGGIVILTGVAAVRGRGGNCSFVAERGH